MIVRRVSGADKPFVWEIYSSRTGDLEHRSAQRFRGMEEAYQDGSVHLERVLAEKRREDEVDPAVS